MPLPDGDSKLAHRLVDAGALLLDVRTEAEFKERSLPNSMLIPHYQVGSRIAEIEAAVGGDKHKPIVVFCLRGGRAATAKQVLLGKGFTEVSNLGGIGDW